MNKWFGLLLCSLLLITNAIAGDDSDGRAADWPQWRGAQQDGKVAGDDVLNFDKGQALKLSWKKEIGQGYSSVSISGGLAVTQYTDGTSDLVVAYDAMTGEEKWRYQLEPAYLGKGGSHNGPSSTPAIDGDLVFALGRKGKLVAINATTGKEAWIREINEQDSAREPFHGFTTAPMLAGNAVIVQTGGTTDNAVSAFHGKTGRRLWYSGNDQIDYQSPALISLANRDQVIAGGNKHLFGIDPASGNQLWSYEHAGNAGSFSPVALGQGNLLIPGNRQAQLVNVRDTGEGFLVEEVWQSRHLKQTFNVPVYHQGYLYGYSGRFLSCVSAETGETVWKSRPPGDGFLMMVDDHLVVLTKEGTLHIAAATPDGYTEKANLDVFDGIAWTPPSFANGRIYARSLSEIASVEIASSGTAIKLTEPERVPAAPNSKFAGFVKRLKKSDNKDEMIEKFLKEHPQSPVIEGNTLAHFVYHGQVKDIVVGGDMFDQGQDEPMFQVPGTDFYFYTVELEADALLGYYYVRNFEERIADPLNDHTVNNFGGVESVLSMPDWSKPDFLKEKPGPKGQLNNHQFSSKTLEDTRDIQVYVPSGYENSSQSYPTVYVHFGKMAIENALMPTALDNLIADGTIEPVIAVFIHPTRNRFQEYARDAKRQYATMVAEELVPFIDENYRTRKSADGRLVMGGDEGGYAALYSAMHYPGTFGMVGTQSAHLMSAEGIELRELIDSSPVHPIKLYMEWGKYDYRSVAGDYNWTDNNRRFSKMLKDKGYAIKGVEISSGFGWSSWRYRTDQILKNFFARS